MGKLTDEMKRVLLQQRLIFVATVDEDGTPNLSPKATTVVFDDDHIAFADIRSPRTVANVRRGGAMEINVIDAIVRKGFRFKGRAEVITEGPLLDRLLETMAERGVTNLIRAAVQLTVERALPVVSPAYDQGSTEELLREKFLAFYDAIHPR